MGQMSFDFTPVDVSRLTPLRRLSSVWSLNSMPARLAKPLISFQFTAVASFGQNRF
jgi:hypothetical protein